MRSASETFRSSATFSSTMSISAEIADRARSEAEAASRRSRDPWRALIASAVGYAMDGFDLLILGFILTPISAELRLTSGQAGSLVTWTLIGAVAGGLIFGTLSDRLGRIRVLSWTILLFAVATGLCGLARGYWDLLAYRTVAGLGLGGEFGIGMALAAESWPAEQRARVSSYVGIGWQIGVLAAAFATPVLLPAIGWRGMFFVGLLPAVASYVIRRLTAEPAVFLRHHAARLRQGSRLGLLVHDRRTIKISAGILVLCSVQNFGYYGVMIWMPTYLSTRFGYTLTRSAAWTAATVAGMIVGIWLFGQLADRFGRRPIFLLYQLGAASMVYLYAQLTAAEALLFGGTVMGLFVNGMIGGYGALISECYPTELRATAQNVLFNLGRAVGGLGPLVVGALAARYSFSVAIALLAAIYVVDIVTTIFLIPELKGAPLD
ncbi:MAG TPA: MFS transporter [Vicinamibacterales bacterium]|nr:MFS transporter [Vicinamibacterales bacterium]